MIALIARSLSGVVIKAAISRRQVFNLVKPSPTLAFGERTDYKGLTLYLYKSGSRYGFPSQGYSIDILLGADESHVIPGYLVGMQLGLFAENLPQSNYKTREEAVKACQEFVDAHTLQQLWQLASKG